MIYKLLSQNFVAAIYTLFLQIFWTEKTESAKFFAFWMYVCVKPGQNFSCYIQAGIFQKGQNGLAGATRAKWRCVRFKGGHCTFLSFFQSSCTLFQTAIGLFSNSGNLRDKHARLSLLECARIITGDVKAENCGQRNQGETPPFEQ